MRSNRTGRAFFKMKPKRSGMVTLVGAGPGDPELITVRGKRLLSQADVVVIDRLVPRSLLAACRPDARIVDVGKSSGRGGGAQASINRLLIREAKAGRRIVRLKGGDPLVFGRGGEEALALAAAGIVCRVVPGVSSVFAVPAAAGIPVTHRGLASTVGILTGHEDEKKDRSSIRWPHVARAFDTLICLMAVKTLPSIVKQLLTQGRGSATPACVIERGTWPEQRRIIGTLGTIIQQVRKAAIQPPAILVVGEVVRLSRKLPASAALPLSGMRVLVTRSAEKATVLAERLQDLGAETETLPAIELTALPHSARFAAAVNRLHETDWVVFTSPEGIAWLVRALQRMRKDLRVLAGCHIAAIGEKTAEAVRGYGLHVDFIPKRFSQEGLLKAWPTGPKRWARAVLFCAEGSREVLSLGLRSKGYAVDKVPIYRAAIPALSKRAAGRILRQDFDAVTVTSASCVAHLKELMRAAGLSPRFSRLRFISIGPITSAAVKEAGGKVAAQAEVSTADGLIETVVAHGNQS